MLINEDGRKLYDSVDVSNEFCYYFSNIATKLDNAFPQYLTDPLTYMPPPDNRSFFITPATPIEIEKLIMILHNKASNINIIPIFYIKSCYICWYLPDEDIIIISLVE